MSFQIVDPLCEIRWDDLVRQHEAATVFHTVEWLHVLTDSYCYPVRYGVLKDGDRAVALLPIAEVLSRLTGRRGVSLPFSDECPPLLTEGVDLESLITPMRGYGRKRGWDYLELRGEVGAIPDAVPSAKVMMHYLTLDGTEEQQFQKLSSSQQRNVRKARTEGVEIHRLYTRDAMDAYYELHCRTRRRQGVPPQPRRFFRLIHEHLIAPEHGFVSLARFDGRWIAGAVYFSFGSKALYKFGASDWAFQQLRANSLLMWEAICHFRQTGAKQLSFGRTDLWNTGLLRFKRSFGAEEVPLSYYRIGICKQVQQKAIGADKPFRMTSRIIQRMPLPLLRLLGNVLYRHMG
jgi:hypothetical protein